MWIEFILFTAAFVAFTLPGWSLTNYLYPEKPRHERAILGIVFGLALAMCLGFLSSYIHLYLFFVLWVAALVAVQGYGFWLRRQTGGVERRPWVPKLFWLQLTVILLLVAVTRLAPLFVQLLPPGFDPSFHMLLARKAMRLKHIFHDWAPFAPAHLNYPLGCHFLLANLAAVTTAPLHNIYHFLMPVLSIITTAQVFLLAEKVSGKIGVAVRAAFAYGLLAVFGGIDYYMWGGMPNQLAMCFLLASLTLLAGKSFSKKECGLFAVFFAATFFAHHHVMITSLAIYAGLIFYFFILRKDQAKAWGIIKGLMASVLIGGVYMIPYAFKVTRLGKTNVFRYPECFFELTTVCHSVGYAFLAAVLAGFGFYVFAAKFHHTSQDGELSKRGRFRQGDMLLAALAVLLTLFMGLSYSYHFLARRLHGVDYVIFTWPRFLSDLAAVVAGLGFCAFAATRRRAAQNAEPPEWRRFSQDGMLLTVIVVLLMLFLGFSHMYRLLVMLSYGKEYVAFTPSRFLSDMAVFLAVFAGYALYRIRATLRVPWWAELIFLLALAASNYPVWRRQYQRQHSPALLRAYEYIRRQTPPHTVVYTIRKWARYCTQRRTMYTPTPITESLYGVYKYEAEITRMLREKGYQPKQPYYVVAIGRPKKFQKRHRVLWQDPSGLAVVEVEP